MESIVQFITSETTVDLVSSWGLSVLGALFVLIVGLFLARIVRSTVRRALARSSVDQTLVPFFSNLVYYALVAFVVIAVLGLFGIPTTSFVALLGAAGLAVGLALQGTLSNFAAGVMLLIFRPFKAGDYVEAGGAEGTVLELGVFASKLETLDRIRIILPNAAIWSGTIKNFTASPVRRNDVAVGISYGDDIGRARSVILGVLTEDARVLPDPAPEVVVAGLGDSSVDLLALPYCSPEDYWGLRFDLIQRIKEALDNAGVSIPFPQRDVHVHETRPLTAASQGSHE